MKNLLAISRLLTRQKLRKLDILSDEFLTNKQSKFRELYDALQDGTVRNDREAAELLYGAGTTDARYRQLKSRFRKRMLNTLFFVDQNRPKSSSFDQTYHNCQRDWSQVNILVANGALAPAEELAKPLLTTTQKYGFSELCIQVASFLAERAAARADKRALAKLEGAIELYSAHRSAEQTAQRVLRKLKILRAGVPPYRRPAEAIAAELTEGLATMSALRHEFGTSLLTYDECEARCVVGATLHDWTAVLEAVESAIAFGKASPRQLQLCRERTLRSFYRLAAATLASAGEDSGAELPATALSDCARGADDQLEGERLRACSLLNRGAYRQAAQACRVVVQARTFKSLGAPEREMWHLLLATAAVLSGGAPDSASGIAFAEADAFLEKPATIGGDYQRLNAWRLLTQAALLRQRQDLDEAGARISQLRELAVRQLDKRRDAVYIAIAQVLYRVERNDFSPYLDRVAERYQGELDGYAPALSVEAQHFEPVVPTNLLEAFGVRTLAAVG